MASSYYRNEEEVMRLSTMQSQPRVGVVQTPMSSRDVLERQELNQYKQTLGIASNRCKNERRDRQPVVENNERI